MPLNQYDVSIINTAIGALPSILALFKQQHAEKNPSGPPPSNEDILTALTAAMSFTVAIDENWKRLHPVKE